MQIIDSFSIKGLFGKKDVELNFKGKAQVYIGENGLGKTTILNTLFYLLSCDFKNLVNVIFSRIDIVIEGKKFVFSKEEIKTYLQTQDMRMRRAGGFYQSLERSLEDSDVKKLQSIIRSGKMEMAKMHDVLQYLNTRGFNFNAPNEYIMDVVTQIVVDRVENNQIDVFKKTIEDLKVRILYFPTYRRIEKDVRSMLRERRIRNRGYMGREVDLESSFVEELSEAVHSGMSDIKKRRDSVLRRISDISRKELDSMTVGLLKKQIAGIPEQISIEKGDRDKIEAIIHKSQIGLTVEEQTEVLRLMKSGEINNDDHKFLLYLLTRLKDIYKSYESYDLGIKAFVEICNGYLRDKRFIYNEAELELDLETIDQSGPIKEVIDLDILSSGEKQLVALFATIYLDPQSRFIILIDEPELSLSIYWQRKLLPDIIKSPNCAFLFAVTHSPFIFENELQEHTTGMNEFVRP